MFKPIALLLNKNRIKKETPRTKNQEPRTQEEFST